VDATVAQHAYQQIVVAQALALSVLAVDDEGERVLGKGVAQQPVEPAREQPTPAW
jgi:hypothetical protein